MAYKNMHNKLLVLSIIILLIGIGLGPSISGSIIKNSGLKTPSEELNPPEKSIFLRNKQEYKASFYKDGNCEKTITITLDKKDKENFINNVRDVLRSDINIYDKFVQILDTLKNYNLVSENVHLSDFFDVELFNNPFDVVNNTNFIAHFAPILIVGGGFGLGVGEIYQPINVFLHLLTVLGGLAWIYVLDPIEGILYQLISFLMPIFIGYSSSYTGLIIFAVKPGLFYSNILAIGFAPFTAWFVFPPQEP